MTIKTNLLAITIAAISLGSFTASAQEDKEAAAARKELAEAEKNVKDANTGLREAKIDSAADYSAFKASAETKINLNKKEIATLKARKLNDTKELQKAYDAKVLALEVKNDELKARIDGSGHTETGKWSSFKREFNHDMSELGKALKDIDKDNTK